ncbi:MAG: DUF1684 domain-containing protein [Chitinophagales bacterium]|nr:DUF1684 domain-containing protein [Chitinophagales bacterium]
MRTILFLAFSALCMAAQAQDASFAAETAKHRAEYKVDFLTNPRSPLRAADTSLLDFYPAKREWAIPANFRRTPEAVPFIMMTYSGQKRDYVQYGVLTFEVGGQKHTLSIYQNLKLIQDSTYRDHLFLPFKDLSNGGDTYGGGRYLDFHQSDIQNGILLLDFNKCYNPWCAYSDGYNCPIPPRENHLPFDIPAGERNFRGEKKH